MHLGDINMSLTSKTKEELMDIIESQLSDIRLLEAEIDEMWNLLDDIKESENMTSMMLGGRKLMTIGDMTAEQIASFFTPIDE
jgi:prefoldin subunit 5